MISDIVFIKFKRVFARLCPARLAAMTYRHSARKRFARGPAPAPPSVLPGDYFRTNIGGSSRCKAYDAPPRVVGQYICTIAPGTCLGPVRDVELSNSHLTILVQGYWINIWCSTNNAYFASKVDRAEIQQWEARGWQHWG